MIDNRQTTVAKYNSVDMHGRKVEAGTVLHFHAFTGRWVTGETLAELEVEVKSNAGRKAAQTTTKRTDDLDRAIVAMEGIRVARADFVVEPVGRFSDGFICKYSVGCYAGFGDLSIRRDGTGFFSFGWRQADGTMPREGETGQQVAIKLTAKRLAKLTAFLGI